MNRLPSARAMFRRAFTLVEVTLALGIAVFCLVVIFGLLNVGINTGSASVEQTNATDILSAVAADLRAAPTPSIDSSGNPVAPTSASPVYGLTPPTNGSGNVNSSLYLDATGQKVASAATARYQLNIWMTAGASATRDPTLVRLMVSWPPADSAVKAGSVETLVALDRN